MTSKDRIAPVTTTDQSVNPSHKAATPALLSFDRSSLVSSATIQPIDTSISTVKVSDRSKKQQFQTSVVVVNNDFTSGTATDSRVKSTPTAGQASQASVVTISADTAKVAEQPHVTSSMASAANPAAQPSVITFGADTVTQPPASSHMAGTAGETSNSPVNSKGADTLSKAPPSVVSPMAVLFPDSKACRLQFTFPSSSGRQTVTDDEDVFVSQLEREGRMDKLEELNKTFKVTEVTVDIERHLIFIGKKGRMSLEGGRKWIDDVRKKIRDTLGYIKSEVIQGDKLSADIHKSVRKEFSQTKLSCFLSHDKQSLLLLSGDAKDVEKAKDFVAAKLQTASDTRPTASVAGKAAQATDTVTSITPHPTAVPPSLKEPSGSDALDVTTSPSDSASGVSVVGIPASPVQSIVHATSGHRDNASPAWSAVSQQTTKQPSPTDASGQLQASPQSALTPPPSASGSPLTSSPVTGNSGSQGTPTTAARGTVLISDAEAKLLQNRAVLVDFLSQLMVCQVIIDTDQISNRVITVTLGDPGKVRGVIDSIIGQTTLVCEEKDEEVLAKLKELSEKFSEQIETVYDKGTSHYTVTFCRVIQADVKAVLDSLKTAEQKMPLPSYKADYVRHKLPMIQLIVQSSLRSPVKIFLKEDSTQTPLLFVSADRAGFPAAKKTVCKLLNDIKLEKKELEPVVTMYLQGVRGRKEVKSLENKYSCQITVSSPWQRALWKGRSHRGHQVLVCEGSVAAADCQVIVLPLSDGQSEWPPLQKHVLDRSFLNPNLNVYASEVGHSSQPRTMTLLCNTGAAMQGDHVTASQSVIIMSVPQASDKQFNKRVDEACEEAFRKLKAGGATSIAIPVQLSAGATNRKCLDALLPTIVKNLEQREDACTVMLCLEPLTSAERGELVKVLRESRLETEASAECAAEVSGLGQPLLTTSKPSIVLCGQGKDVTTSFEQIQQVRVPEEFRCHATLLMKFLEDQSVESGDTTCQTNFWSNQPLLQDYQNVGGGQGIRLVTGGSQISLKELAPNSSTASSSGIISTASDPGLMMVTPPTKTEGNGNARLSLGDQMSQQPGPSGGSAGFVPFDTKSGIKVDVYKADLTTLIVDAIVNAANEHLSHGRGVAYAIARAAGFSLEYEGEDYIRRHGPLKVTEVAVTTGGSLPCKKVLHAVGPRWLDYTDKGQCRQHLVDTVFNCLLKADGLGFASVALPSISSAIFGVPQQICAESYLSAVQRFDDQRRNSTSLKHIHFVDVSDDMVTIIQKTFTAKWNTATGQQTAATPNEVTEGSQISPTEPAPNCPASGWSGITSAATKKKGKGQVKITKKAKLRLGDQMERQSPPTSQQPAPSGSSEGAVSFVTKSGIKVHVYKTDITKLPVDAIGNAANEQLSHGGGVAYTIARAAGFSLEYEGEDYIRRHGPLKVTEVAVTTGGSLPCKKVLHAVGPRWSDYTDKAECRQHLVDTVFNCLLSADSLGFISVALPSISSAIFGVPKQVCAESYLSAVQKFDDQRRGSTSLTHIHFVDVSYDMVTTIQKTFTAKWDTATGQQTAATPSKLGLRRP